MDNRVTGPMAVQDTIFNALLQKQQDWSENKTDLNLKTAHTHTAYSLLRMA